jgi:hypothetical protein
VSRSLACLRTVLPDRPFLLAIRRLAFNQSNLDSLSRATAHSQSSGYSAWASWRIDSVPDNSPSRNQPNRFFWISLRNFSIRAWSKDRIWQGVRQDHRCESVVSPKKLVDLGHNPNICLVGTQNLPVRFSRSRQPLRPGLWLLRLPPDGRADSHGVRVVRDVHSVPVTFPPRPADPGSPLSRLSFQRSIRPCGFVRPSPREPRVGPDGGSAARQGASRPR